MKSPFFAALAISLLSAAATPSHAADRLLTCASARITALGGVRLNLIQSTAPAGVVKAVLYFGTTRNSTETYAATRKPKGVSGQSRSGDPIELLVSGIPARNAYIDGVRARLDLVVYSDVRTKSGKAKLENVPLVCGKQIAPYGG